VTINGRPDFQFSEQQSGFQVGSGIRETQAVCGADPGYEGRTTGGQGDTFPLQEMPVCI
jgi:hypothetical protein